MLLSNNRPDENWAVYFTKVDEKPAVILLDLALRSVAPVATHPQLFVVRVEMQNPREDGLFTSEESDVLYSIDDAVMAAIATARSQALHVGKLTSQGAISYYFYYPEQVILKRMGLLNRLSFNNSTPVSLEQCVDQAMTKFVGYKYQCLSFSEPDWGTYLDVLYPGGWELQQIGNDQLLRQMQSHKDNTAMPRQIDHYILCPSAASQVKIKTSAEALGFRVAANPINEQGQYSLDLIKIDIPDKIDDIVWPLFKLAEENNAIYDGWGATVVKE